jgi:hypothetical protein
MTPITNTSTNVDVHPLEVVQSLANLRLAVADRATISLRGKSARMLIDLIRRMVHPGAPDLPRILNSPYLVQINEGTSLTIVVPGKVAALIYEEALSNITDTIEFLRASSWNFGITFTDLATALEGIGITSLTSRRFQSWLFENNWNPFVVIERLEHEDPNNDIFIVYVRHYEDLAPIRVDLHVEGTPRYTDALLQIECNSLFEVEERVYQLAETLSRMQKNGPAPIIEF